MVLLCSWYIAQFQLDLWLIGSPQQCLMMGGISRLFLFVSLFCLLSFFCFVFFFLFRLFLSVVVFRTSIARMGDCSVVRIRLPQAFLATLFWNSRPFFLTMSYTFPPSAAVNTSHLGSTQPISVVCGDVLCRLVLLHSTDGQSWDKLTLCNFLLKRNIKFQATLVFRKRQHNTSSFFFFNG